MARNGQAVLILSDLIKLNRVSPVCETPPPPRKPWVIMHSHYKSAMTWQHFPQIGLWALIYGMEDEEQEIMG